MGDLVRWTRRGGWIWLGLVPPWVVVIGIAKGWWS
jgi:hypothetical protein